MSGLEDQRSQILDSDDYELGTVEVPKSWGGHVHVRALTGPERYFVDGLPTDGAAMWTVVCTVALLGMCDANGEALFDLDRDLEAFSLKQPEAIQGVFERVAAMSGITMQGEPTPPDPE